MVASGVGPDGAGGFGPGGGFGGGQTVPLRHRRRRPRRHLRQPVRRRRRPAPRAHGRPVRSAARTSRPSCTSAFDDAIRGVTSTVRFRADATCSTCAGSGAAPGTMPETCPQCHGAGTIADNQGPFSFSQVCPTCGGRGQVIPTPCPTCHGRGVEVRAREVKVRIPAGVADGQRIRVKGRGGAGANGGPPGDLYVIVHVRAHPLFGRNGNDLTLRLPVTFAGGCARRRREGADARRAGDGAHPARNTERQGAARPRARASRPTARRRAATCSSPSTCRFP